MKRLLLFIVCTPLFSMYNNSPAAPELPESGLFINNDSKFGLKAGYLGSSIFRRRMELEKSDGREVTSRNLKNLEYVTHQGVITGNYINRVETYIAGGTMRLDVRDRLYGGDLMKYSGQWDYSLGAGARAILILWKKFSLGVNVSYLYTSTDLEKITQNGIKRETKGANMHYDEWQVGTAVSRQFGYAAPYIGLGFGKAMAKIRRFKKDARFVSRPRNASFTNRTPATFFVGTSFTTNKYVVANVEAALLGELGLSGSIDLRF